MAQRDLEDAQTKGEERGGRSDGGVCRVRIRLHWFLTEMSNTARGKIPMRAFGIGEKMWMGSRWDRRSMCSSSSKDSAGLVLASWHLNALAMIVVGSHFPIPDGNRKLNLQLSTLSQLILTLSFFSPILPTH
jgi:hypothetical protein